MPGLITRRTNTTVELRDGQSFAIAGLFQQDYNNAVQPGALGSATCRSWARCSAPPAGSATRPSW